MRKLICWLLAVCCWLGCAAVAQNAGEPTTKVAGPATRATTRVRAPSQVSTQAQSAGESPASTRSTANAAATQGITHEQADAILNELRQIRRLLETDPQPVAASAPAPRQAIQGRMSVAAGWLSLGRDDAPVTLVEFTDYQCPYCRRFHAETFAEIKKQYIDTGKVRFVSRDMPLSFHPNALPAAEAAHCAGDQGKFWEMRGALLEHNDKLGAEFLSGYAQGVGLDAGAFRACLESGKHKDAIQKEASESAGLGVSGTPGFLLARTAEKELSGEVMTGALPFSFFDSAIKKLLQSPSVTDSSRKPSP